MPTPDPPAPPRAHARQLTFEALYERYSSEVYRFALWLTGDPHDARDITSETFVRAWTTPDEPQAASMKAYLLAIATNLHRRQSRRAARQRPLDETAVAAARPVSPTTSPEASAQQRETFQRAFDALQRLPELDRTILLLRAERDLSYQDIAAATGLSAAAARVRVFRARAALASLLHIPT